MARATKCTTVAGVWDGVGGFNIAFGVIGVVGIVLVGVTTALVAFGVAALTPATMIIAAWALFLACTLAITFLTRLRDYFFDFRLICLGNDRCALGRVNSIEDNDDGDQSLNLVLAPANEDTSLSDYRTMYQASELVFQDPGLSSRGFTLDPFELRPDTFGRGGLPFLHCEIEGTYFDDWTEALLAYLWVLVAIAIAAFALATLATALGPIAWIIWIAVALFVILAAIFGLNFLPPEHDDPGSVGVDPVGDATPSAGGPVITDAGGNSISVGDFVVILGRPVCDTGHSPTCWDELHPVTGVARVAESDYRSAPATHVAGDIYDTYCSAVNAFVDDVGKVEQGLTVTDDDGKPKLTCLEHPAVG